jgi:hypothetical protein
MRYHLTHIGVHRTSVIMAIVYGLLSLLVFPILYFVPGTEGQRALPGIVVILGPPLYAIGTYVVTAVFCWVYNLIAPRLRGIPVVLESDVGS